MDKKSRHMTDKSHDCIIHIPKGIMEDMDKRYKGMRGQGNG